MSDHTALWLLFALLSVLFVLVVITARRGPWSKPHTSAGILWIPAELATRGYGHWSAFAEDDERFVAELRSALQSGVYDGAMVPEVRIMRPGPSRGIGGRPVDFTLVDDAPPEFRCHILCSGHDPLWGKNRPEAPMTDEPSFEDMQAAGAAVSAAVDQFTAICRPHFAALAAWERACLAGGMSEQAAALYTMRLAEAFNWPAAGAK